MKHTQIKPLVRIIRAHTFKMYFSKQTLLTLKFLSPPKQTILFNQKLQTVVRVSVQVYDWK